jgi:hypothetical protein
MTTHHFVHDSGGRMVWAMTSWFPRGVAAALLLATTGCYDQPAVGSLDAVAPEWDVLPRVADGAYRGDGFLHVTPAPYASAVAAGKTIDVWVSHDGWSEFLAIDPDATGSGVEVPRGTIIVREVHVDAGVEGLTVMARGAAGTNPGHGDWWYGVLDVDGWPTFADGLPVMGALVDRCAGCHAEQRADDGFVFGVPLDARDPSLL